MLLEYYKKQLGEIPSFIKKYLKSPCLVRLKNIGYFCGMDYASKEIYDFQELITRYDHSLTVAMLVYKLTKDKKATIAGLFHDVSTPCFAHVIDYMNQDYSKQESTEQYTKEVIRNDSYLLECLKKDKIEADEIINFKKYTIVDNDRPKLCADRLDGIILTAIGWSKNITKETIKKILEDITVYRNETEEYEIGFSHKSIAKEVLRLSEKIDELCHSKEDNYMMNLLGMITKKGLEDNLYTYDDLFILGEKEILKKLESSNREIKELLDRFYHINKKDVPIIELPNIKKRNISPLVKEKRII